MRRKIIAQGLGGRTIFLPIRWVRENDLTPGDEVELVVNQKTIEIASTQKQGLKKKIELQIKQVADVSTRMILVNAYRAGFDTIEVAFDGRKQLLEEILSHYFIGFEITNDKSPYIIEAVSEPDYENFEGMLQRLFYITQEAMSSLPNAGIEELVHKVQRYDNFLKRCISKGLYTPLASQFLWQFLSNLSQIARICYHFNNDLMSKKMKLTKKEIGLLKECQGMFDILKRAYLKNEMNLLQDLHLLERKVVREEGKRELAKQATIALYHILSLARMIYLAQSPLLGILEMKNYAARA